MSATKTTILVCAISLLVVSLLCFHYRRVIDLFLQTFSKISKTERELAVNISPSVADLVLELRQDETLLDGRQITLNQLPEEFRDATASGKKVLKIVGDDSIGYPEVQRIMDIASGAGISDIILGSRQ